MEFLDLFFAPRKFSLFLRQLDTVNDQTMFYDVEPFWFYVLIERKRGDVFTTVGYFSKEKNPVIDYNLSCIMVLPAFMGHGYGKFRKSHRPF